MLTSSKQAAAGAPDQLPDEVRLAHRRFREDDIGRRVLEQDRAADRLLHLVDMIGDTGERRLRVGERQQIVEIGRVVRRPGEMLGDERRLVAIDERLETPEMRLVERLRPADRHAHAVQRHRIVAADAGQRVMRRAAGAHVVFGMNLEEAVLLPVGQDRRQMLMLEAGAGEAGNRMRRKAEARRRARGWASRQFAHRDLRFPASCFGLRRDVACQRLGRALAAAGQLHRGAGAAVDELPGIALVVDGRGALAGRARAGGAVVLALERDAEALLLALHPSPPSTSASVSGAAAAIDASAVATAPARMAALTVDLADMLSSPVRLLRADPRAR